MNNPLKACREERNLSQAEMGALLDVDEMTISRWERGKHLPRKKHWLKIEEVTGITVSQLVGHVGQVEEPETVQ